MNAKQPKPLKLSGPQQALYEALGVKDQRLANMYLGALKVLADTDNPDRLAQASHSLRELLEKLPRHLDVPVRTKRYRLRDKIQNLRRGWHGVMKHSDWPGNPAWSGTINAPLRGFLKKAQGFFAWFEVEYPTRKEQTAKVLRSLDPLGRPLPVPIERLRVEEWDRCHRYFEGVGHHNFVPSPEDFDLWLFSLERFLMDQLCPRTFEDHSHLDQIITEGEANAEF